MTKKSTAEISGTLGDSLLQPISKASLAGRNLLYDPLYDAIRQARKTEDENLPQGIWHTSVKKGDWSHVESLCCEALRKHSKDLQIMAWLMEAWLHLYGVKGLNQGLKILLALCQKYWDSLYPLPRGEDLEFRLAPFEWMNEKLVVLVRMLPITCPDSERVGRYTLVDWKSAVQLAGLTGSAEEKALARLQKEGGVTLEQFNTSKEVTPAHYYQDLKNQSQEIIETLQKLHDVLAQKNALFGGALHHLRDEVKTIIAFCESALAGQGQASPELKSVLKPSLLTSLLPSLRKGTPMNRQKNALSISSREEAYALLDHIATYLETIEPHSPTPLLIRRAISWGTMSLKDILQELLQDKNDFLKAQDFLGLTKKPNETS